jgi:hypothetical protein
MFLQSPRPQLHDLELPGAGSRADLLSENAVHGASQTLLSRGR